MSKFINHNLIQTLHIHLHNISCSLNPLLVYSLSIQYYILFFPIYLSAMGIFFFKIIMTYYSHDYLSLSKT